jgi:CRP-like cAMP-binding protein
MAAMEPTSAIFQHLRRVLQQTYFLHSMTSGELDKLVASLKPMRVFKGYEIIKRGQAGDAFYLIASGRVSVWVDKGSYRAKAAELRADDYFGEMALISNEPRSATVMAEGLTELFALQKSDFERILMKNSAIAEKIRRAHQERGIATSRMWGHKEPKEKRS